MQPVALNRKLLGRTCLLCRFFHLLQFPKNDAPLKVQVTPGHTSKNGPKAATSLHPEYAQERCAEIPADQGWNVAEYLPECQHLSVHQNSVRFRVQAFLCFARILLVSRHFCGIAMPDLQRHNALRPTSVNLQGLPTIAQVSLETLGIVHLANLGNAAAMNLF